jgi:hypothetical protein
VLAAKANALGDFLRARCEQVRPEDVGLVGGTPRGVADDPRSTRSGRRESGRWPYAAGESIRSGGVPHPLCFVWCSTLKLKMQERL